MHELQGQRSKFTMVRKVVPEKQASTCQTLCQAVICEQLKVVGLSHSSTTAGRAGFSINSPSDGLLCEHQRAVGLSHPSTATGRAGLSIRSCSAQISTPKHGQCPPAGTMGPVVNWDALGKRRQSRTHSHAQKTDSLECHHRLSAASRWARSQS